MTILATHVPARPGSYSVTWELLDNRDPDGNQTHTITYGLSVKSFSCNLAASREFGECIRHSLECAGIFEEENT